MLRFTPVAPFLLILASCGGASGESTDANAPAPAVSTPTSALPVELAASIAALRARPEHTANDVEVQHILIAFAGATRSTATRSRDEAEQLTGEIYAKVRNGEDFTKLMKQYTGDPGPGTYPMSKATRAGMVAGFGNVGWRLQVGEIGVAPYDTKDSPFGWHVIKRLK